MLYKKENESLIKSLIEKERDVPEALENINQYVYNLDKTIELKEGDTLKNDFHTKEVNLFKGDVKNLEIGIKEAIKSKKKVVILAGNSDNAEKIKKALEEDVVITPNIDDIILKPGEVVISEGALTNGFQDEDTKLLVISSDEFFAKN